MDSTRGMKTADRAAQGAARLEAKANRLRLEAIIRRDPALTAMRRAVQALDRAGEALESAAGSNVPDYYQRAKALAAIRAASADLFVRLDSIKPPANAQVPEAPALPFGDRDAGAAQ